MNQYTTKCQLKLLPETIQKLDISDGEYFSDKYKEYVSNSKLKYINPEEGGSPELFFGETPSLHTNSLSFGSAIHELILQPEEFFLSDYQFKPDGKYALLTEIVKKYRKLKYRIYDAIKAACEELHYYEKNKPQTVLKRAFKSCIRYYLDLEKLNDNSKIVLSPEMKSKVEDCIESYNRSALKLFLHADDFFNPREFFNEQAIICDFLVILPTGKETRIPFKLKIDNYSVNNKSIILNDLKTTGKDVTHFKKYEVWNEDTYTSEIKEGSYFKFHYYRQLACYLDILSASFGPGMEKEANILAIESFPPYNTCIYTATVEELERGRDEFKELMCRIAYHKIYGREQSYPE